LKFKDVSNICEVLRGNLTMKIDLVHITKEIVH